MSTDPSPVDVSADLSPVDASPSLQTADIGSSVKRVRGPTRSKNTSRLITQHGGKKLFVGVLLSGEHSWGLMPLRRLMNWGHKFDFKPHCKEQKIGRTFHQPFKQLSYNPCGISLKLKDMMRAHFHKKLLTQSPHICSKVGDII